MPRTAKPKAPDVEPKNQEAPVDDSTEVDQDSVGNDVPEVTEAPEDPNRLENLDEDGRPADDDFEPEEPSFAPETSTYVTDFSVGVDSSTVSATPAEALNTPQEVDSGFQPDNVNASVPGGFAQSTQNNLNDVRYTQPVNDLKPVTDAVSSADPNALAAVLNSLSADALATIINAVGQSKGVNLNATATQVEAANDALVQDVVVAGVKKPDVAVTFRNDVHKNIQIQELDMSQQNPSRFPLVGRYIQFSNGVFIATTQNQVDQLDWMSKTDDVARGGQYGNYTLGGNKDIYRPAERLTIDVDKLKAAGLTAEQIAKIQEG